MDQYLRLAGNPGFNASIDHIRERLVDRGIYAGGECAEPRSGSTNFANEGHGWDYRVGTVTFADDEPEPLLSRDAGSSVTRDQFLFHRGGRPSCAARGLGAVRARPTIKVRTLPGAVVLTDAPLGRVWPEAVKKRGAAGVISTAIARYVRPSGRTAHCQEEQKDVLQWGQHSI